MKKLKAVRVEGVHADDVRIRVSLQILGVGRSKNGHKNWKTLQGSKITISLASPHLLRDTESRIRQAIMEAVEAMP